MGGAAPPTKIQQVKRFEIGDDVEGPDDEKASSLVAKYCEKMTLPLPKSTDTVHKEECVFSFDNAFTKDGGLYINLSTFVAVGKEFLSLDMKRSKVEEQLYLNVIKTYEEEEKEEEDSKTQEPVTKKLKQDNNPKSVQEYLKKQQENAKENRIKTSMRIVLAPSLISVRYPYKGMPDALFQAVETLLHHEDSGKKDELKEFSTGEDEVIVSKYAKDLVIADNGVRISPDPKTWKCADSGLTENLWLNLSDGYIGSGRKQYGGLGGTGAALRHYQEMKKKGFEYPLVVKLGTITAEGADVYSYAADEDRAVKDPWLAQHLARRGINIMECVKTEKTTQEMSLDASLKMDLFAVDSDGKKLERVKGPGLVGLTNLGNTCYMNSCLQLLFSLPETRKRYLSQASDVFLSASSPVSSDLNAQMCKLAVGLLSTRNCLKKEGESEDEEGVSVRPRMFKSLIGKGHTLFSTNKQQDALEFWQHLLSRLDSVEDGDPSTNSLFEFETEIRKECMSTHGVKYQTQKAMYLGLFPGQCLDKATNQKEVDLYNSEMKKWKESNEKTTQDPPSAVAPLVPFEACLQNRISSNSVQWISPATGKAGTMQERYRIKTFPKYLTVIVWRWFTDKDWVPKKLNVELDMPSKCLDLERLRATGRVKGESLMAEKSADMEKSFEPDLSIVSAVVNMGFTSNAGKRAALATKNAGPEEAVNWVLSNMTLTELNDPLPEKKRENEESKKIGKENATPGVGSSKYELIGLITHQGKNAGHGHYVCHARRDLDESSGWFLFNDRKVTKPGNLPLKHAYIYLYRQV